MAMRKVNKGYLRYFGDTKKGKLFNNEIDILALLIILVFIVLRPLMRARKKNDIGGG